MARTVGKTPAVPIPSYILDAIPHLKECEVKVLLAVSRRLIESGEPETRITITELEAITKMTREAVSTAAIALDEKGLLNRRLMGKGYRSGMLYSLSGGAELRLKDCERCRDRAA